MIKQIETAIKKAFGKLMDLDGTLFDCPLEAHAEYESRKLHEVCVNHKLAIYLEEFLFPLINQDDNTYFTDIEFNREGIDFKNIRIEGQEKRVRPDIIIHNRKSGIEKQNFIVVECKKESAPESEKEEDIDKLKAFLTNQNYKYEFGLQVIYGPNGVTGTLFFIEDSLLKTTTLPSQHN